MKVGIQLYSVRNHMRDDPIGTIRCVAEAGYRSIEAANHNAGEDPGIGFDIPAGELKKLLDETGARIVGCHIFPNNVEIMKSVVEYFSRLETGYLAVPMGFFKDKADTLRQAEGFNEVGRLCSQAGITLVYHNHFHEFQVFEGKTVFDHIMENTDPALVKIELDTYWAVRGGQDAVKLLERYGGRVVLIHQKDFPGEYRAAINLIDPVNKGGLTVDMDYFTGVVKQETFTEIGAGILPIQDIINMGNAACKADYIILEQDFSKHDELESIKISMERFKKFSGIEWRS
ncbi:MAG: sugar phosphate isomerase/epimerase [Treponema sp.]|jgi:sugar phosphate isomerase/epimerase|nr:sugar phosphate isomerase/epimerase [Treponema sp.]